MSGLQITWYILIMFLLTIYAVLDGFDLGAGVWHLFAKKEDRPKILGSIGPFWDGNEVWLLTGSGAIFAAFPYAYATVFSGFYLAFMLLIFSLAFRAVAIEYRGKSESLKWQNFWDFAFAFGSIVPALLFGIAAGNIIRGIPLSPDGDFTGNFFTLLNPYAILTGLLSLSLFATHGAAYLNLKTDGELKEASKNWNNKGSKVFAVMFLGVFAATLYSLPEFFKNFNSVKILWLLPSLILFAIIFGKKINQFIASTIITISLMIMFAIGLFPNMVPAINDPALNLTIANASSSALTLKVMLVLTLIGMPFVIIYTVWIYKVFKGKTQVHY